MVKYGKETIMCIFKDKDGKITGPANHIFADELKFDREKRYITLEMKGEHVMFNTHVEYLRICHIKVGNNKRAVAYIKHKL